MNSCRRREPAFEVQNKYMKKPKMNYPSAEQFYPQKRPCRYCKKLTHGIVWNGCPYDICNACAIPVEYHGDFVREPDGAVSLS